MRQGLEKCFLSADVTFFIMFHQHKKGNIGQSPLQLLLGSSCNAFPYWWQEALGNDPNDSCKGDLGFGCYNVKYGDNMKVCEREKGFEFFLQKIKGFIS